MAEAEVTVIQLLALKMDSGAKNQGIQPVSKSWKRQAKDCSPEPPEDFSPAKYCTLAE